MILYNIYKVNFIMVFLINIINNLNNESKFIINKYFINQKMKYQNKRF